MQQDAKHCDAVQNTQVTPRGVEQSQGNPRNNAIQGAGGAESGAHLAPDGLSDPRLAALLAAWSGMSEDERDRLAARADTLVDADGPATGR